MGSVIQMQQASDEEEQYVEVPEYAVGLVLCNTFFPEEVLINILSFVDWDDMPWCRLVCKSWQRLVDSLVMYEKLKRESKDLLDDSFTNPDKIAAERIPFYVYFAISQNVFGSNMLKNGFGSGGVPHICRAGRRRWRRQNTRRNSICSDTNCPRFKHWNITASGGDGWIVEGIPVGSQPLPLHLEDSSCFATSYNRCHKEQLIDLEKNGLNAKIMHEVRPDIEVSEWYAGRFDCGMSYKLCVSLLDDNKQVIDQYIKEDEERTGDDDWRQVIYTFSDYGPGVRYILFEHEGRDSQFWAGNYGCKMAGGSVIARIPSSLSERTEDGDCSRS